MSERKRAMKSIDWTEAFEHGVLDRISVFQRSWQENLSDLPVADVSLSSRSFFTDDLADDSRIADFNDVTRGDS